MRRHWVRGLTLVACVLLVGIGLSTPLAAAPAAQSEPTSLQAMFASVAKEFGVPDSILLAVSYNLSRWEHHAGQPSTGAGYGLMHLTATPSLVADAKGDRDIAATHPLAKAANLQTLVTAATLIGQDDEALKRSPHQNIRGGAALLAQYARETTGGLPSDIGAWYEAVAKFSGSPTVGVARDFANEVYATIREGKTYTTSSGETVTLLPQAVTVTAPTSVDDQLPTTDTTPECPAALTCRFIPAAYQINTPGDPSDYGNYDLAEREANGLDIRYIVIHDTETTYQEAIDIFSNPLSYVSAHYVIRASDGDITQMVRTKDVAYQAGNWFVNIHSIGIEHEGVAIDGAAWYSEAMYRASAKLTRYLANKYNIPLDRAHIVGHDNVPGVSLATHTGQHWDPGPFGDWAHYMELLGAPIVAVPELRGRNIVTIRPTFASNKPVMIGCDPGPCHDVPRQPSNFVFLHTAPSDDAPFLDDPALPGAGTNRAEDWGDKAVTGQRFWRVESQGDWDAIFFGGQKAWFRNPRSAPVAFGGVGTVVSPRADKAPIQVFGTAYPAASEYPPGLPVRALNPLQYTIPVGQAYVTTDYISADVYYAPTFTLDPNDHLVIKGAEKFYQIEFNHRFMFVKAADVDVVHVR